MVNTKRRGCGLSYRAQSVLKVLASSITNGLIVIGLITFTAYLKPGNVRVEYGNSDSSGSDEPTGLFGTSPPIYRGFSCADGVGAPNAACTAAARQFIYNTTDVIDGEGSNENFCETMLAQFFTKNTNLSFESGTSFFGVTLFWGAIMVLIIVYSCIHDLDMILRRKAHFWPVNRERVFWTTRKLMSAIRFVRQQPSSAKALGAALLIFVPTFFAVILIFPVELFLRVVIQPKYYSSLAVLVGFLVIFIWSIFIVIYIAIFGFEMVRRDVDDCACTCNYSLIKYVKLQYLLIGTIVSVRSAFFLWGFQDDVSSGYFYSITHVVPFIRLVQLKPDGPALSVYKHLVEISHRELHMQHRESISVASPHVVEHLMLPSVFHASQRGQRRLKWMSRTLLMLTAILLIVIITSFIYIVSIKSQ